MKKIVLFFLVACLTMASGAAWAEQPAAVAPKAAPAAAALTISRMEIAGSVADREPVGVAATFPATQETVSCFLEFKNVSAETTVNVVWTLGPNEMGKVPLTIRPSSRFRTWSNKSIGGMKGDWKVEVLDASGAVLKSATFKVE
jgi:hypothetical protein